MRNAGNIGFDENRIEVWDWSTTNIRKESQTIAKFSDSIQRKVIEQLLSLEQEQSFDIVFDDDDSHEVADVVAIKLENDRFLVELFHCKYSSENNPGGRVEDLYAVCGQAQRCVHWKLNREKLFRHLRIRDESRRGEHGVSRFELGTLALLREIEQRSEMLPVDFRVFIVQPGPSKENVSVDQLALLASTEVYLKETHEIPLEVIASA